MAADATQLPFAPASFDCLIDVVCLVHHSTSDMQAILCEAARVLKPDGRIFSVMPAPYCWRAPYEDKGMVQFLDKGQVSKLFAPWFSTEIELTLYTEAGNSVDHWLISGTKLATGA